MRLARTLVCVLLMGFLAIPVAEGHLLWHPDAKNDAEVDDLVGVRLSTYRRDGVKMLRLNADFRVHEDFDDCCYIIRFVFDSRGDGAADFTFEQRFDAASGGVYSSGLFDRDGDPVKARFVRACTDDYCEDLPVRFKFGLLHPTRHIRWFVETGEDRAPDVGWFEH